MNKHHHATRQKTSWHDRFDAGRGLAREIRKYAFTRAIVLAVPRGGVEVGYQMAIDLGWTLSIVGVKKVGTPGSPELAMGAVAENSLVLNYSLIDKLQITESDVDVRVKHAKAQLEQRIKMYRHNAPFPFITNKIVVLVDDGMATGMTAEAAISSVKIFHPRKIVYASPVASLDAVSTISHLANDVVTLAIPEDFKAVGDYYENFHQVSDKTVVGLLEKLRPQ